MKKITIQEFFEKNKGKVIYKPEDINYFEQEYGVLISYDEKNLYCKIKYKKESIAVQVLYKPEFLRARSANIASFQFIRGKITNLKNIETENMTMTINKLGLIMYKLGCTRNALKVADFLTKKYKALKKMGMFTL